MTIGITVRMRGGTNERDISRLVTWLKSKNKPWFISIEMRDTNAQHIHAYVEITSRPNNVTLGIKKLLNIQPKTAQWYHAVVVKEAKDKEIWLGYCAKENDANNWMHNLSDEKIEEAIKVYREQEVVKQKQITLKNCIDEMKLYVAGRDWREDPLFHEVLAGMEISGQYDMVPFLVNKCKYSVKDIWLIHTKVDAEAFMHRQRSLDCPRMTKTEVALMLRKLSHQS